MYIPSFDDVKVAHKRIRPHIHRTPVLTSTFINAMTGAEMDMTTRRVRELIGQVPGSKVPALARGGTRNL